MTFKYIYDAMSHINNVVGPLDDRVLITLYRLCISDVQGSSELAVVKTPNELREFAAMIESNIA